jgi:hypothetical protein
MLEIWTRWPEMLSAVDEVVPAEELGERFRRPGLGVNACHFYSLACFPPGAAQMSAALGLQRADDGWRARVCMDFFRRTAGAWRADGFTTNWSSGGALRPYPKEITDVLADSAVALDRGTRDFARLVAGLAQYTFLVHAECRVGVGDTGPYPLPHDRVLLVRELTELSRNWLPWSDAVAEVPHDRIVLGIVLSPGVSVHIQDTAIAFSDPPALFEHVEAVSVFSSDAHGNLSSMTMDEFRDFCQKVSIAAKKLYRKFATMDPIEKFPAGAIVNFSHPRPWVAAAGLADSFDWAIPRDSLPYLDRLGISLPEPV